MAMVNVKTVTFHEVSTLQGIAGVVEKDNIGRHTVRIDLNSLVPLFDKGLSENDIKYLIQDLTALQDFIMSCNVTDKVEG